MTTKKLVSLSILLTSVCLLAYFLLVGSPVFGTNDDVGMAMISAGALSSHQPTSSLLFIHPIYGMLLQSLYTLNGEIPWYGILFITILCSSLSILNFSSLRIGREHAIYLSVYLIFLLNLLIIFPALYHLQFTIVSGISSLAGFILFYSILIKPPRRKILILAGIATSLFIIFTGAMIRVESFYLVCLLVAPITLILVSRELLKNFPHNYEYTAKVSGLTFSLMAFGIVGLGLFQSFYYSSPDWQSWFSLNRVKAQLIDYRLIEYNEETEPIFQEVGWSETDYNMIRSWQYVDSVHFSVDKFRHLSDNVNVAKTVGYSKTLSRLHEHLLRVTASAKKVPFLALAVITLFAFCLFRSGRLKKLGSVATLTSSLFVFLYLSIVLNRTEFRTDLVMLIVVAWTLLFLLLLDKPIIQQRSVPNNFFGKNNLGFVGSLATLLLILWMKYDASQVANYVKSFVASSNSFQENVLEVWDVNLPSDSIIYVVGAAFPYEYYSGLQNYGL